MAQLLRLDLGTTFFDEGSNQFGDREVAHLQPLKQLKYLNLNKTGCCDEQKITEIGAKVIGKLTDLEELHLRNKLTDAGSNILGPRGAAHLR